MAQAHLNIILYIINRQIYFKLEIRCLQLQKNVGKRKTFKATREQFEIDNLSPEQENKLCEFFQGQNIFLYLPTDYTVNLWFSSAFWSLCSKSLLGSSVLIVTSSLRSLIEDQIHHLNNMGQSASDCDCW